MTVWLIVGVAFAILGAIAIIILQWPEEREKRRKKKHLPAPEPEKDWKAIAERLERRIQTMEASLHTAQQEIKDREKKVQAAALTVDGFKKKLDQEKVWREKEEALVAREKKQERILEAELHKTREELNTESTQRIKQEYELKDLRQVRDDQGAQVRKLSAQNMDLDKRLTAALSELKDLRVENTDLRRKKEDEEWVAKSDYKGLEVQMKRTRWEVEQFKKKFPMQEWPKSLQPKPVTPPAQAPAAAVVPVTEPAPVRTEPPVPTNDPQQGVL